MTPGPWDLDNLGWKIATVAALASITSAIYAVRNFYAGKRRDKDGKKEKEKAGRLFVQGQILKDKESDIEAMYYIRTKLPHIIAMRKRQLTETQSPVSVGEAIQNAVNDLKYEDDRHKHRREIRHTRHADIAEKLKKLPSGRKEPEDSPEYAQELLDMVDAAIKQYEKDKQEWIDSHTS